MAGNLLEMMSGTIGKQFVDQASQLGLGHSNANGATMAALSTLLGGVMQKASAPSGASDLMKLLNTPGLDSIGGNLGSTLASTEKTNSVLSTGSGLLTSLFGGKLTDLINTFASMFGLKSTQASNLLALAAP